MLIVAAYVGTDTLQFIPNFTHLLLCFQLWRAHSKDGTPPTLLHQSLVHATPACEDIQRLTGLLCLFMVAQL